MRLARPVAEAKFAREIELLDSQRSDLAARGIFVLGRPVYPRVDLLFVPRNALVIQVQAQQS